MRSEIYTAMREVAKQGGNVAAIKTEMDRIEKIGSKIKFVVLFVDAFHLSISQCTPLLEWSRLKGCNGLSDEEIDQTMMPLIRKNLGMEEWKGSAP